MPESEKIGTVDLAELKRTARQFYVTVPKHIVDLFQLAPGDVLKVAIREVHRKPKAPEA